MRSQRRHNRGSVLLNIWACFLIPAYTLLFAGGTEWLNTNFSVRAVLGLGHYWGCVVWSLLVGGYFLVLMARLSGYLPEIGLRLMLHGLILTAYLSLTYAVAIPYLPRQLPRWARLHVMLAAGAAVLLMAALLLLLIRFVQRDRRHYLPLLAVWLIIALVSGMLFVLAGMVSTALEVFFTISATLLIRELWLCVGNQTP